MSLRIVRSNGATVKRPIRRERPVLSPAIEQLIPALVELEQLKGPANIETFYRVATTLINREVRRSLEGA